jgi:AraC family transcriptional regulator of adaptative response / DNA-3-methyladenine glycosylase II
MTGIYCRPICPARPPLKRNIRFFLCSAAAEAAGFRPCRRCRPDTVPGTPAWSGKTAVVGRAIRLIREGAIDGNNSVDDLADRLGLTARHLRRLAREELGTTLVALARTHRSHLAKRLLDDTDLPMHQVAYAAGFGSTRRFNDAIRKSFGLAPREIKRRSSKKPLPEPGVLSLELHFKLPYDWDSLVRFLGPRATPGVETVSPNSYSRTYSIGGSVGTLEVQPCLERGCLYLLLPGLDLRILNKVVQRVRWLMDCDSDPARIGADLSKDHALAKMVRLRPGLRVPGAFDGFELAIRAILGQQVTVRGATTLAGRLVGLYGTRIADNGNPGLTHLFPAPEVLASADLSAVGLPRARAATINLVAKVFVESPSLLDSTSDAASALDQLLSVPGIGAWTAQYVAMRALRDPDAFPAGDLALRKNAPVPGPKPPSSRELEDYSQRWRPWRAYAAMHLWTNITR